MARKEDSRYGGPTLKKRKKKKSSGCDSITQEKLVDGSHNLAMTLLIIINRSITSAEFSSTWKEEIVTPVLKKENEETLKNYTPVICLPAASFFYICVS